MKPTSWIAPWLGLIVFAVALAAIPFALPGSLAPDVYAEDGPPDEEDPDLGDKQLPFAEQVNQAIERGVSWLLAKPELFTIPGVRDKAHNKGAFFGQINAPTLYGGGTGPSYHHPAGSTALALYTLLKCGVDPKHPIIQKGFNWIRFEHGITEKWDNVPTNGFRWTWTEAGGSYELSAMILALTARWDPHKKSAKSKSRKRKGKLRIKAVEDREWLQEMCDELVKRRGLPEVDSQLKGWRYNLPEVKKGGKNRSWSRPAGAGAPPPNEDLSSTQLAALALYSAHRFGIKVDPSVWYGIVEFTLAQQEKDGPEVQRHMPGYQRDGYSVPTDKARGFCYNHKSTHRGEGKATGSMTACGVANLLMAREFLAKHKKARKKFLASDLPHKIDKAIDDGLAWLDSNWSSFRNPRSSIGYHTYYLYGIERCMDMRGKRLLGRHVWYEEGAKQLLKRQKKVDSVEVPKLKRGSESLPGVFWNTKSTHEPHDVLDTCFALLFLKRATWGMVPPPSVVTGD